MRRTATALPRAQPRPACAQLALLALRSMRGRAFAMPCWHTARGFQHTCTACSATARLVASIFSQAVAGENLNCSQQGELRPSKGCMVAHRLVTHERILRSSPTTRVTWRRISNTLTLTDGGVPAQAAVWPSHTPSTCAKQLNTVSSSSSLVFVLQATTLTLQNRAYSREESRTQDFVQSFKNKSYFLQT